MSSVLSELIRQTQRWAIGEGYNAARAAGLRRRLLLANHEHYRTNIPAYRKLCVEEGIETLNDLAPIKARLMSTDDLFKSYSARWLDEGDFPRMNQWLGEIHHRRITTDVQDVTTVDEWVARLAQDGLRLVYSSGTSGKFSFIPRDERHLQTQKQVAVSYLAPLLLRKIGKRWQNALLSLAARLLPLEKLTNLGAFLPTRGYDALFLDFRNGRTGMQMVGQEAAALFRNSYYLYESELDAATLRALARGVHTDAEQALVERLRRETVTRQDENFRRVLNDLTRATREGQKIFIFGAPFQLKALGEYIEATSSHIELRPGSLLFFGGGWKAFSGEKVSRDALVALLSRGLGLAPEQIIEGYSMVELNVMNVRCDYGRFHIPPIIEPVLFDEELLPLDTLDGRGIFGFLDPLATSYPGFLITGDLVRMVTGTCACGIEGAAITEIGRAADRDVKGCAGIMAAVRA